MCVRAAAVFDCGASGVGTHLDRILVFDGAQALGPLLQPLTPLAWVHPGGTVMDGRRKNGKSSELEDSLVNGTENSEHIAFFASGNITRLKSACSE